MRYGVIDDAIKSARATLMDSHDISRLREQATNVRTAADEVRGLGRGVWWDDETGQALRQCYHVAQHCDTIASNLENARAYVYPLGGE